MRSWTQRIKAIAASLALTASLLPASAVYSPVSAAYGTGKNVVEYLDRGIVAIKSGSGMFVSWRYNANDSDDAVFKLYRDGSLIYTSEKGQATSYWDGSGSASSTYKVETVENGTVKSTDTCSMTSGSDYFTLPLDVPAGGSDYSYSPNDCSVGDVDGDGQYEIFVKWDPSNSQDNSKSGYTGNVYIDCYTLDGTKLWRIDLGKNIRAGAHYTQFIVADFDGDGKAEMTCKTADGTKDGTGRVIGNANADYRNSGGYVLSGPEYYTLFDGETGAILDTVNYEYPRGEVSKKTWGDDYGNRVDRFLGAAVYLDGVHPSAVSVRGYYTRMTAVAYDVVNKKLVKRWGFDTGYNASAPGYGDGNHNCMPADVDGDGKQELLLGAIALDDNGKVLWCNRKGHGDAMHLSDFLPDRPGLEFWVCHEHVPYGVSLIDARTGQDIFHFDGDKDTGRCAAGNIYAGNKGAEFWGARPAGVVLDGNGQSTGIAVPAMNFLSYWDGDLERELLDNIYISKIDPNNKSKINTILTADGCASNNSTKATPNLSADIFGDWREELILRTEDNKSLRIYTTNHETQYRLTTLMHDTQYRMQVSSQQCGYNQPPHPSFYLGSDASLPDRPAVTISNGGKPAAKVTASFDTTKTYTFKNKNSGLYMTAEGTSNLSNVSQQPLDTTGQTSYWKLEDKGGGYYMIKSAAGNVYLDLNEGKTAMGTNIQVYQNSNSNAQQFKFLDNGDGSYIIATKPTGGRSCVEITNAYENAGANVQQWEINGHACQSWIVEAVGEQTQPTEPQPTETQPTDPQPVITPAAGDSIVGDIDGNGKVNIIDLLMMKRIKDDFKGIDRQRSDTNADGFVDEKDIKAMTLFLSKQGEFEAVKNSSAFLYAEDQTWNKGVLENYNLGYKRANYVNLDNEIGSYIEWQVYAPSDGNYLCNINIANGNTDNRIMRIDVNSGSSYWMMDFMPTGSWTTWNVRGIVLPMNKGKNTIKMTSQTSGGGPNIDYLYMEKTDEPIAETYTPQQTTQPDPQSGKVIYIAGDSTVQTYRESYAPQQGWGAYLSECLGGANVANHSIAGRSSKSFYDNGRLDTILNTIKSGDLLLVQFAINDSASNNAERYAPTCGSVPGTQGSYEWYLQKYIEGAKEKGATPVMVTTVIGLKAYSNGRFVASYTNYCDAMKKLANYYQIPCIDLNTLMVNHYNSIGYDAAYKYHMVSTGNGSTDMTHFTETGAKAVAKLVADEMKKQGLA